MPTDLDNIKKMIKRMEDQKLYDLTTSRLRRKQRPAIKEEVTMIKKSRVWQKFYKKVFTNIVLPAGIFFALLSLAFGLALALTYFGMHPGLALLVGPAVVILGPLLFVILRGLYKEAVSEVTSENKKLMKDLKGDR